MCGDIVHPEIQPVDISSFLRFGEIEFRIAITQQLIAESGLIILIGIGPEMEPDETECVGGMIGVEDLFKSIQAVIVIMQRDIDRIIHRLLPVLGRGGEGYADRCKEDNYSFSHAGWVLSKINSKFSKMKSRRYFPLPLRMMRSVCSMILKSSASEIFSMYSRSNRLRSIISSTFSAYPNCTMPQLVSPGFTFSRYL